MGQSYLKQLETHFTGRHANAGKTFSGAIDATKMEFGLQLARYRGWLSEALGVKEQSLNIGQMAVQWMETGTFEVENEGGKKRYDKAALTQLFNEKLKGANGLAKAVPSLGKLLGIPIDGSANPVESVLPGPEALAAPARLAAEAVEETQNSFWQKLWIGIRAFFKDPLGVIQWIFSGFSDEKRPQAMLEAAAGDIAAKTRTKFQAARQKDPALDLMLSGGRDEQIIGQLQERIAGGKEDAGARITAETINAAIKDIKPVPVVRDLTGATKEDLQAVVSETKKGISTVVQRKVDAFFRDDSKASQAFWQKQADQIIINEKTDPTTKWYLKLWGGGQAVKNKTQALFSPATKQGQENRERLGNFVADTAVEVFKELPTEKLNQLANAEALASHVSQEIANKMKSNPTAWMPRGDSAEHLNPAEMADAIGSQVAQMVRDQSETLKAAALHAAQIRQLQRAMTTQNVAFLQDIPTGERFPSVEEQNAPGNQPSQKDRVPLVKSPGPEAGAPSLTA